MVPWRSRWSGETLSITPTLGAQIANITINFGDNTSQDLGPVGTQTVVPHQYTTIGQKIVTVTQREVNGRVTLASVTVSVTN